MSYDNSGILFPNNRKTESNHPDFNGKATIGGQDFELAGWKKVGANGPFLSLSLKPKQAAPPPQNEDDYGERDPFGF